MSLYGLDPTSDERTLDYAARNPQLVPDTPTFAGVIPTLKAAAGGAMSGWDQLSLTAAEAATPILRSNAVEIDKSLGTNSAAWLDDQLQKTREIAMQGSQVNPLVYGKAGAYIHGATDFITRVGVGAVAGGAPGMVAALASSGPLAYRQALQSGVDPQTAAELGTLRAAADVIGGVLPMQGKTIMQTLGIGAGTMAGMGAIDRGATGAILTAAGYPDMAKQYQALDGSALMTDAIMGLAFGGFAHGLHSLMGKLPTQDQLPTLSDAALLDAARRHVESSGPGIPADMATLSANVDALTKAMEDHLAGRSVEVSDKIDPATAKFVPDPAHNELVNAQQQAMSDHFGEDALRRAREDSVETGRPAGAEGDGATETSPESVETRSEAPGEPSYLKQIMDETPDRQVAGEDGEPTTAAEVLKGAETQATQSEEMAKMVQTAADCAGAAL